MPANGSGSTAGRGRSTHRLRTLCPIRPCVINKKAHVTLSSRCQFLALLHQRHNIGGNQRRLDGQMAMVCVVVQARRAPVLVEGKPVVIQLLIGQHPLSEIWEPAAKQIAVRGGLPRLAFDCRRNLSERTIER
jgi:hypothetical protein